MTLEELQRLAEAAKREGLWYGAGELRDSLFARIEEHDQDYIAAVSPAAVLKLLEMIRTLRCGMEVPCSCGGSQDCHPCLPHCALEITGRALKRADEIERTL